MEAFADNAVSEIITTYVKPGKEAEYEAWAQRAHRAEAAFPGYCGGFLQPPVPPRQPFWTTLVRFGTPEELEAWLASEVRRELLAEHDALVESWQEQRLPSAFAGWFAAGGAANAPPVWKQSTLVLLALFPIVMLELRFLTPRLGGLHAAGATFAGNALSVALLSWPVMPLLIGRMNWWLAPGSRRAWTNLAGAILIVALYALEIGLFLEVK